MAPTLRHTDTAHCASTWRGGEHTAETPQGIMRFGLVVLLGGVAAHCPSVGEELDTITSSATRENLVTALRECAFAEGWRIVYVMTTLRMPSVIPASPSRPTRPSSAVRAFQVSRKSRVAGYETTLHSHPRINRALGLTFAIDRRSAMASSCAGGTVQQCSMCRVGRPSCQRRRRAARATDRSQRRRCR